MSIDTKALRELLAKATPGPVEYAADSGAIIGEPNEWLCQFWDKSEEDCPNRDNNGAFVAWLWNNAHAFLRAADRLAELEEQLHLANIDALQTEAERAALEAENQRLRAELARVRGNRTEAELRQLKHDLETAGISAFMSPEKLPKEEWYSSAAFCRDVVRRARYVVEDMIAALSQPAERESLPLMARSTCLHLAGSGGGLGDTPVTVGGTRYLVADTDEHGLPVIPRTADIPEGAMYYVAGEYFSALPSRAIREMDQCFRIEDYRPAAQEGCHG